MKIIKFGKDKKFSLKINESYRFNGWFKSRIEFFQSLLDSHEEVLQLPGILYIDANLIKILSIKSKESLAKEFINQYPNFFDSRKSDIERHYMLGSNKKKFYKVEKKNLLKIF